ncbi:hypothetical protein QJQ45_025723 [Haematococcus lacustris]|nr:hypothetical protein QJQ45_025723 [Haematococcus lacustris]
MNEVILRLRLFTATSSVLSVQALNVRGDAHSTADSETYSYALRGFWRGNTAQLPCHRVCPPQDPAIKQMAEQIASDPSFKQVTESLQSQFGSMFQQGAAGGGGSGPANPAAAAAAFDPSQYMQAMSGMFQNKGFMEMAEKLGQSIIQQDPGMAQMMKTMQDPEYRTKVESALKGMKEDPELKPMLEELETAGPMAMMKYWQDPEVLAKLGKAMGGAFDLPGAEAGAGGEEEEAEEEQGEEEAEASVHSAASAGDVDLLKKLLSEGAAVDDGDEEGRTALHFAAGYGEHACVTVLLEHKASLNAVDNNKNTPLHYAAGYGQAESCKMLLDSGADKSALNADGKTALEVAQLNEQEDVVAVLSGTAQPKEVKAEA